MAYLSPGVYVEEVSSGARPIEAVGTSTAGFVGEAPDSGASPGVAVPLTNFAEFVRRFAPHGEATTPLAHAVHGFFLNGGSRCYVVNSGKGPIEPALAKLDPIDEIAIIAAPGLTDAMSYRALLDAAERMRDRVAVLDGPAEVDDVEKLTRAAQAGAGDGDGLRPPESDRGDGAVYFPWLLVRDPLKPDAREPVRAPPSGHIAGLYSRTDADRGVHKAPANATLRGALGVSQLLGRAEQDVLNPAGVNCIRSFAREGVRVWGARTLAPSASEWRFLNVRRLFNMMEESIAKATRWIVFEPNDVQLWNAIRRDVSAFLTLLWRQGALRGATPEEAFFVKCDAETNPQDVIDAGQVVTLIGAAPVKPAEFVIFRIGQSAAGATIETA